MWSRFLQKNRDVSGHVHKGVSIRLLFNELEGVASSGLVDKPKYKV